MLRYLVLSAFIVAAVSAKPSWFEKQYCKIDLKGDGLNNDELETFTGLKNIMKTEDKNGVVRQYVYGDEDDEEKLYVKKYEVQNRHAIVSLEGYVDGFLLMILQTSVKPGPRTDVKVLCE